MKKIQLLVLLLPTVVLMGLVACGHPVGAETERVDSLNVLAYEEKYASLERAGRLAEDALREATALGYRDGVHEAWLRKGDVYGMRMDYDSAQVCYKKVLEESNNDLMCSMADVNMMSVCLMTSQSKEFYDYRGDAEERLANVAEEEGDGMSAHEQWLWKAVRTDYHFVSLNYFSRMRQEEGVKEELEWLSKHRELFAENRVQMLVFLFLSAMYDGGGTMDEEERQRSLVRLLSMSKEHGLVYFEVSALNALARSVMSDGNMRPSRRVFLAELMGEDGVDSLDYRLANRALRLAREYGNGFVETTVLITLSDYALRQGEDSLALLQMERALQLINKHHRADQDPSPISPRGEADTLSLAKDTTPPLGEVREGSWSASTEMRWIADPNVMAVPEWMASVREQLSIIYGAMGRKAESDENHNIYFDILDATRQDLRVQQEEEHLRREERMLNVLLWGFAVAFVVLTWGLILYNKRSRREYNRKVEQLERVIAVCKRLSGAMTDDVMDEGALEDALHRVADEDVVELFPVLGGKDWTTADTTDALKGLDREMYKVLQVFYHWMKEKGLQYVAYVCEQQRLESETYEFERRLEENKRQYIEKLTSMSIVNGVTPFLDRALHEVNKWLLHAESSSDGEGGVPPANLQYLRELIVQINQYNDVLGHWVKIRRGWVTLNVENFALQPLFDTMKRAVKAFEVKGISLQVEDTPSVVKADKALTLFMMNTLMDNARKYTPNGGRVTLSAEEGETYVEIAVEDTGHGMSAEDVAVINHQKVYDSSKIGVSGNDSDEIRENKGFGFGLMNCKGIIGKYKKTNKVFDVCEFGVKSEQGKGSRFFFRLPKGMVRALTLLLLVVGMGGQGLANPLERAASYADSIYVSNVAGNYEQAILYADSAILQLNEYYRLAYPKGQDLMVLEGADMGELAWWKSGFDTDYELIIGIRNEVAIAALALNRNSLYHYNTEVFTRLYTLTSTDPTLEDYCNSIRMANRNKKTLSILLGMLIFFVVVVFFFLHYRHHQLFIFNLRQLIELNRNVFTATEEDFPKVFHQSLSDIKSVRTVGMMVPSKENAEEKTFFFTGDTTERRVYESLMQSAYAQKTEVESSNGHFHAYPLFVPGSDDGSLTGVLGICFGDATLTAEERLLIDLVAQFMSIHTYFSYRKVNEMNEMLELKQDERQRIDAEQQRVYVRNQIMDNCLSTLKHETMYYPHRIKQMLDVASENPDAPVDVKVIRDMSELLSYYKEVFTILSACAGRQVELVLFKRTTLSAQDIAKMAKRSFNRQGRKWKAKTVLHVDGSEDLQIQGDRIYLQILIDNIISLYFEHQSGGDLWLNFAVSDGFAKFAFADGVYRYSEEDIPSMFYIDHVRYDAGTDTLVGAQYLICRQVIREHDAHSTRRGCRLYVENNEDGQGSRFVFTLPVGSSKV